MSIVKPKHPDEYQGQMFIIDHWGIKKNKLSWQRPVLSQGVAPS